MGKFRIRRPLDQALFVVLIRIGAVIAAVLDVEAVEGAIASDQYGLAVVAAAALPGAPIAASAAGPRRE